VKLVSLEGLVRLDDLFGSGSEGSSAQVGTTGLLDQGPYQLLVTICSWQLIADVSQNLIDVLSDSIWIGSDTRCRND
jgi:hypothetical protein